MLLSNELLPNTGFWTVKNVILLKMYTVIINRSLWDIDMVIQQNRNPNVALGARKGKYTSMDVSNKTLTGWMDQWTKTKSLEERGPSITSSWMLTMH